jgi:GDP-D-mannose 3', 5'-epimerase
MVWNHWLGGCFIHKKIESMQKKVIVCGSAGFIGSHLVRKLKQQGHYVIGVDIQPQQYEKANKFYEIDLRSQKECAQIFAANQDLDECYLLAAMMGGMGYIGDTKKSHDIMIGSTQIVSNVLDACVHFNTKKLFYSSSACVYNMNLQDKEDSPALKEYMAYPALPDLVYGWQKLCGEIMCQSASDQHGLNIRIARFHNIFGVDGIWDGGKEKAPAAICRKVAQAKDGDTITIWGDGSQRRSFLYIDECLEGVSRLMVSDYTEPLNIGSDEDVSIKELAEIVIGISGKRLSIEYDLTKPQGVRGRNSNNDLISEVLNWHPIEHLKDGLEKTYLWINEQVNKK